MQDPARSPDAGNLWNFGGVSGPHGGTRQCDLKYFRPRGTVAVINWSRRERWEYYRALSLAGTSPIFWDPSKALWGTPSVNFLDLNVARLSRRKLRNSLMSAPAAQGITSYCHKAPTQHSIATEHASRNTQLHFAAMPPNLRSLNPMPHWLPLRKWAILLIDVPIKSISLEMGNVRNRPLDCWVLGSLPDSHGSSNGAHPEQSEPRQIITAT